MADPASLEAVAAAPPATAAPAALSPSASARLAKRTSGSRCKAVRTQPTDKLPPITRQEKRFAQLVAAGWPYHRCYTEATGAKVAKKNHAEVQAWKWRLRPVVEAEIIRQRAALTEATAVTRVEKRNILSELARDDAQPGAVRISAIAVDNRMTGDDEPLKVVVGGEVVFTVNPFAGSAGARVVDAVRAAATVAGAQVALEAGLPAIEAEAREAKSALKARPQLSRE